MCVVPVDVLEHGQHAAGEHGLEEGEGGLQVPEHDLGLRQPIRGEYCVGGHLPIRGDVTAGQ